MKVIGVRSRLTENTANKENEMQVSLDTTEEELTAFVSYRNVQLFIYFLFILIQSNKLLFYKEKYKLHIVMVVTICNGDRYMLMYPERKIE